MGFLIKLLTKIFLKDMTKTLTKRYVLKQVNKRMFYDWKIKSSLFKLSPIKNTFNKTIDKLKNVATSPWSNLKSTISQPKELIKLFLDFQSKNENREEKELEDILYKKVIRKITSSKSKKDPMIYKIQRLLNRKLGFNSLAIIDEMKSMSNSLNQKLNSDFIKAYQLNNISYENIEEFNKFKEIYKWSLNDYEKKKFNERFNEKINVVFRSSWIDFGIFLKNSKRARNGIMFLQLRHDKVVSSRNKSLFYSWVNVKFEDWKQIAQDPTGTNFWKIWYHKNRTNHRHITRLSIYHNNSVHKTKRRIRKKESR